VPSHHLQRLRIDRHTRCPPHQVKQHPDTLVRFDLLYSRDKLGERPAGYFHRITVFQDSRRQQLAVIVVPYISKPIQEFDNRSPIFSFRAHGLGTDFRPSIFHRQKKASGITIADLCKPKLEVESLSLVKISVIKNI
jgi:hypothetical protein